MKAALSRLEESRDVLLVDDLHVHFTVRTPRGRRTLRAVDGVSLRLARGETLGLVGESGCGKSTLVRTIFGINAPASGRVEVLGSELARLTPRSRRAVRNRMQLVFQDPYSSLDPRMSAHDIVAEPLRIVKRYSRARVVDLLEGVGLSADVMDRRPGEFSGGQRQRLGIARALALDPDVLVLDEPVSALDVSVQAQVINVLEELQERLGLAYLFIAHDLSVVRHISDRVAVMHLGKIVETGPTEEVFARPMHPYTRALLAAAPVPDPRARGGHIALVGELPDATATPSGCSFRTRCPIADEVCATVDPTLGPARSDHMFACHRAELSLTTVAPRLSSRPESRSS
ncbi:ABC transporter ATP-binding protein [Cellulomonas xiejunii]|uniref:ATP-binding cassette domain-containing protein n=1 Tax=Cellulomonas xiejunii TaxID=2968083 RepID=A0ABY5KWM4_9CELL|nr:oligopeptide/dipeptide ABC transporter ATP-binding protein [Cellulomonas xiejunii]MCC2323044.1 ATP-binding cassette domain-containing protein [Cellulomonas xiejunii]UUI73540.1 ATP-binding cassette domain-containing protein [Cellulomonas xiejunii]